MLYRLEKPRIAGVTAHDKHQTEGKVYYYVGLGERNFVSVTGRAKRPPTSLPTSKVSKRDLRST
jgi:hypothetical protein